MGLEVSGGDMDVLVADGSEKRTTENLQCLHMQHTLEEVSLEEKEKTDDSMAPSEIENSFSSSIQGFREKNHPDKAVVSCVCSLFNDNNFTILGLY